MRTKNLALCWLGLLLVIAPAANAYYADVDLSVESDGSVTIAGLSNHPLFTPGITDALTSKNQDTWTLNLTLTDVFDDYLIRVALPEGAVVTYAKGPDVTIRTVNNHVQISVAQSGLAPQLLVQYHLERPRDDFPLLASLITAAIALAALLFIARSVRARNKRIRTTAPPKPAAKATLAADTELLAGLPARQRDIIMILRAQGGVGTQRQVEERLAIPKSSVSRNIESLVRRGFLSREPSGMTNTLVLREDLRDPR